MDKCVPYYIYFLRDFLFPINCLYSLFFAYNKNRYYYLVFGAGAMSAHIANGLMLHYICTRFCLYSNHIYRFAY